MHNYGPFRLPGVFILQIIKLVMGGGWLAEDAKLVLGTACPHKLASFSVLKVTNKMISPVHSYHLPLCWLVILLESF